MFGGGGLGWMAEIKKVSNWFLMSSQPCRSYHSELEMKHLKYSFFYRKWFLLFACSLPCEPWTSALTSILFCGGQMVSTERQERDRCMDQINTLTSQLAAANEAKTTLAVENERLRMDAEALRQQLNDLRMDYQVSRWGKCKECSNLGKECS